MPQEPMNPTLMDNYRQTLRVNSAPSFIDSSIPPMPVSIVSQGIRDFSLGQISAVTTVVRASAGTTTVTVPASKKWRVVYASMPGFTSQNFFITLTIGGTSFSLMSHQAVSEVNEAREYNIILNAGDQIAITHTGLVTYEEYS